MGEAGGWLAFIGVWGSQEETAGGMLKGRKLGEREGKLVGKRKMMMDREPWNPPTIDGNCSHPHLGKRNKQIRGSGAINRDVVCLRYTLAASVRIPKGIASQETVSQNNSNKYRIPIMRYLSCGVRGNGTTSINATLAYQLPKDAVVVRERVGKGNEDHGPASVGGESSLDKVMEDKSAARLDTVFNQNDTPRRKSATTETTSRETQSFVEKVRAMVHCRRGGFGSEILSRMETGRN
ncbi:hypothetical protein M5K25_002453 [Dendrobium thyrsiflorum]|uniref:Uncharacterized protein n=1 Tax=Dendrobium thyrsiflorum TaxID=117978 RepID=A0ABD0VMF0_DENTH